MNKTVAAAKNVVDEIFKIPRLGLSFLISFGADGRKSSGLVPFPLKAIELLLIVKELNGERDAAGKPGWRGGSRGRAW